MAVTRTIPTGKTILGVANAMATITDDDHQIRESIPYRFMHPTLGSIQNFTVMKVTVKVTGANTIEVAPIPPHNVDDASLGVMVDAAITAAPTSGT